MIAQTADTKQHTLDEIKRFKTKTYCPVTQMQKLNRKLADILNETDAYMRGYLTKTYLQDLDLYHINGTAGSLLPQPLRYTAYDWAKARRLAPYYAESVSRDAVARLMTQEQLDALEEEARQCGRAFLSTLFDVDVTIEVAR